MKKISIIIVGIILAVTIVSVGAEYTDSNPLVTLSYINETVIPKITEDVKNAVLSILSEQEAQAPEDTQPEEEPETQEPEIPPVAAEDLNALKYSVVFLPKGQKLMATGEQTSSLEVILRAGGVVTVSPFDDQGIADLTSSKELYNNDPLVKNNYCIIPRGSDGRGFAAVDSDAYILVRGEYEIVQQ